MSFLKKFLVVVVCVFELTTVNSQGRTLGTWKSFTPYGSATVVCNAGDFIYCACTNSVFSYEKSSGVIQTYDKATGLSDVGIRTIAYSIESNVLVIAYINSNIDLIFNGTDVYNIPDIKNESTSGAIAVNSVSFFNGKAYISTDMGVSVINLAMKEISATYVIGSTGGQVKTYATYINNDTIYAATEEGLKRAAYNSTNLQNFNSWKLYGNADSLPQKKVSYVQLNGSKAYAVISDSLFEQQNGVWRKIYFEPGFQITSLSKVNGQIYFTSHEISGYGTRLGKVDSNYTLSVNASPFGARSQSWFESNGFSWVADLWNGLARFSGSDVERIVPDGPGSAKVFGMEATDNVLRVASGGVDDSWGYTNNFDGFFTFSDGKWKIYNGSTFPSISDYGDVLSVATISATGKTYVGSYRSGLIELNNTNGNLQTYDKNNSILEGATGDAQRTKISALAKDSYGNLWMGNAGATKQLKMLTVTGEWKQFSFPYGFDQIKRIMVDQNDQLWMPIRRGGDGILVWSHNNTFDDASDDRMRQLKVGDGQGALPSELVHCIAEDKEGNIWAGTNQGIGIFYCAGSVLTSNGCDADQIKVERDGYIGYLFGTESVRAIAVDAANRKWIGTTNGLWLISADGKNELLKFTKDNSPLPDNQITDIAIEETTGEVFIGTLGGLVSYQGDAVGFSGEEKAMVYPNPVKHEYDGPIAIKGLTQNAYVKITDVSGTLVYQGKANGTQMIWNGRGYKGDRAKSGVYLVFSSTDLGKEKQVAKILLLN